VLAGSLTKESNDGWLEAEAEVKCTKKNDQPQNKSKEDAKWKQVLLRRREEDLALKSAPRLGSNSAERNFFAVLEGGKPVVAKTKPAKAAPKRSAHSSAKQASKLQQKETPRAEAEQSEEVRTFCCSRIPGSCTHVLCSQAAKPSTSEKHSAADTAPKPVAPNPNDRLAIALAHLGLNDLNTEAIRTSMLKRA
jgi:hypothetical protein